MTVGEVFMEELIIRKDNRIVQKTINKFTYKQNQLMALLLGKFINLKDNVCLDTSITISEIQKCLGLSDGAENYDAIKRAILQFGENGSIGCLEQNKKGEYEYVWRPYFKEIRLNESECIFSWNNLMKPYLIELRNNYTQYLASDYLKLKNVHSQNLYEQLKSLENFNTKYGKNPEIYVEDIRNILQTNGKKAYDRWGALKQLVLDKAIKEINEVTDIEVTYTTKKRGKNVVAVVFDIKRKNWNYTKKQKENIPDWYNQTQATISSDDLLDQVKALQEQMFEPENIND